MNRGPTSRSKRARHRRPELGKYLLWLHFAKDPVIRKYLPPTRRYSRQALAEYLGRYGTVYVKPSGGSRGHGVVKVSKRSGSILVHHTIRSPRKFSSAAGALQYVDSLRAGKPYIVQRGISLARVDGRPFDIRVMMQREAPRGKWLYSGMAAKVAGAGSVVTNVALSHGRVIPVEDALSRSLGWSRTRVKRCVRELIGLGQRAARHFDTYQLYRELGFDVAVDTYGRIWLIEENTKPSHALFRKMAADRAPYRRIEYRFGRYQRALTGKNKV